MYLLQNTARMVLSSENATGSIVTHLTLLSNMRATASGITLLVFLARGVAGVALWGQCGVRISRQIECKAFL